MFVTRNRQKPTSSNDSLPFGIFMLLVDTISKYQVIILFSVKSFSEYETRAMNRDLRLQLHGAIYRPDSFVLMLRYCANLKAIRYESTCLNRIVADKSHRVIAA